MTDHEELIDTLSRSAGPVKRPLPTIARAILFLCLGLPCAMLATSVLRHGWTDWSQPGAIWPLAALVLSFAVGALGIATAFDLGIPGRKTPAWTVFALLIAAWLVASVMSIAVTPDPVGRLGSGTYCYSFMTLAGAPMVLLAILALRRTRALKPGKALAVAGLGVAFTASSLLMLCHSIDEQVIDFLMHLAAAATLVGATVVLGRRWVAVG